MDTVRLVPIDVGIIRCLQEDARSSIAGIADKLGMPESTVRHHLRRLVEQGVIEFTASTNPLQLGYQIWAIIEVQADLRRVRSVAERLASAPEVYFVGLTTGGYDILVGAVFRSNEELLDFITGRLSKIRGITRTATSSVLKVVKRDRTFGLPDDILARGHLRGDGARTNQKRVSRRKGSWTKRGHQTKSHEGDSVSLRPHPRRQSGRSSST